MMDETEGVPYTQPPSVPRNPTTYGAVVTRCKDAIGASYYPEVGDISNTRLAMELIGSTPRVQIDEGSIVENIKLNIMFNDTASAKRKATPIFSGVLRYFPDAMAAVSRLSKIGNDKHNPGEPLHWAREKSTDHGDCIVRHQVEFDKIDPDSGEYHAASVAWRALAQLQLLEESR